MSASCEGKKILIAGMGISGRSAAAFLSARGARITAYDRKPVEEIEPAPAAPENFLTGDPGEIDLSVFDEVVVSPGIPPGNPLIKKAVKMKIPVKSELQVGLEFSPPVKIVSVTGTNGKTTTCALLEYITGGRTAGNIGKPLTGEVDRLKRGDFLILEASSYQIPFTPSLSPDVGVLLNIFPEHIEWHGNRRNYMRSKKIMFLRQSPEQNAVFNARMKGLKKFMKGIKSSKMFFDVEGLPENGVGVSGRKIFFTESGCKKFVASLDEYPLKGRHNVENLLAALCAARIGGFSEKPHLSGFKAPPHRMENAGTFKGVNYVDDSKSTNFHSTLNAVKASDAPVILMMGGRSKGICSRALVKESRGKVKEVIAFGESAPEVRRLFKGSFPVHIAESLREAVKTAAELARPGFTVLMSPGGSSFDEFDDYVQRGEKFKQWVKEEQKNIRTI